MTVTRFTPVRRTFTKRGPCPECGYVTSRSTTIEHTVNPFNRDADGNVKDYGAVLADVEAKGAAWEPDFRHQACGGGA